MSQIRRAELNVAAANALALQQSAFPSVVTGCAFIFRYRFLSAAAGFHRQPLGDR